jgi:MscS family membrane protein
MRLLTSILFALCCLGQIPGTAPVAEPPKKEAPTDPFGRETPRSSITGFLRAAQSGHYRTAAQYLQVAPSRRETAGVKLAQELEVLLDSSYKFPLSLFSSKPEGALEDSVPLEQDRMGEIRVADDAVDMVMIRVKDPQLGQTWVVSAETLAKVTELSSKVSGFQYLHRMPEGLQSKFLGLMWAQWLGLIVLAAVSYGLAWLAVLLFRLTLRFTKFRNAKPPTGGVFLLAVLINTRLIDLLVLPLLYQSYYRRIVWTLFLVGFTWALLRAIDGVSERLRLRALATGQIAQGSWIVLGKRIVKALTVLALGLVILAALGFNLSTALAGLGIGGIAVALSAQKTIENLFGGVSVASDEVIRVGDTLRFGTTVGTVSDIGLRSTRLRTIERTELSIPNGALATMNVENLSMRDKMLFNPTLGLTYDTTAAQLQAVLNGIRELFRTDPRVESEGYRARFAGFGENAMQIEIWAYVLVNDWTVFLGIREELLFSIMKIVHESGSGFAFPSRTLYLAGEGYTISGTKSSLPTNANTPEAGRADLRRGSPTA